MDGSAFSHVIGDFGRAAWAIAFFDHEAENPRWTVQGPVPSPMPQTPQAAEQVAMAVATQLANATWTGFSDCMAVVKTCKQNEARQMDGRAMHAGIRKFAIT